MRFGACAKWLWACADGYRWRIFANGVVGTLHVGVSLLFVWMCKLLIDVATRDAEGDLRWCAVAVVGCMVAQLLLSAVGSRMRSRMEIELRNKLSGGLFEKYMRSRWVGREAFHSGDVLNRLEGDVPAVSDMLCRAVPSLAVTKVQLAGALWLLAALDGRLAAVTLLIMPLALLFSKRYMFTMRRLSREIREADSCVQSHLQEHLQHRTLVRVLEFTPHSLRRMRQLQAVLRDGVVRRSDFSVFSRLMVQTGFAAGYAVAFLWGVFGLRDGTVTFGMMTAFLQLVAQIQRPMVDLSRQIPAFAQVSASVERLAGISDLPLEEEGVPMKLRGVLGIRVERLSFAYPDGVKRVLDGFSHDFVPSSLTAVVGETGAGKSTLARLMLALLTPDAGTVTIYNKAGEETVVSPRTRCNLTYVPQGNSLVSGTIRENLLMGNPAATEAEMRDALHTAVAEFVFTLPDGLDTLCGERGAGLSEGQAQRVAIARGLLRPGSILLLDEPTASLDGETERLLFERLLRRAEGKTLVLITHSERVARLCSSVVRIGKKSEAI